MKWISVKDELPPNIKGFNGLDVWAGCRYEYVQFYDGQFYLEDYLDDGYERPDELIKDVTHWCRITGPDMEQGALDG